MSAFHIWLDAWSIPGVVGGLVEPGIQGCAAVLISNLIPTGGEQYEQLNVNNAANTP